VRHIDQEGLQGVVAMVAKGETVAAQILGGGVEDTAAEAGA